MRFVVLGAMALSCCAGGSAWAQPASAQPAPRVFFPGPVVKVFAQLTYEVRPGAGLCPDEERFRQEMQSHMGLDSFQPNPEGISVGQVHLTVTRSPAGFSARYAWTGSGDAVPSTAQFRGPGTTARDCLDVLAAVAVSLSTRFEILEHDYGEKLAPRSPAPAEPAECAKPPPAVVAAKPPACEERPELAPVVLPAPSTPTPAESETRLTFRLGAAAWTGQITTDRGAFGLTLDAGARYGWFSGAIEGRVDPPLGSTLVHDFGTLNFLRITGALLACMHFRWLVGCAMGEGGRILFTGSDPPRAPKSYGAVGVRLGLDFPAVPPRLFVRVAGDVLQSINPAFIMNRNQTAFQVAATNVGLGVGVLLVLDRP